MVSVVAVAGVSLAAGLVALGAASTLLGFGHILSMVAGQGYTTLRSAPTEYARRFGGVTVWISVGQALGIPVVGVLTTPGVGDTVATGNATGATAATDATLSTRKVSSSNARTIGRLSRDRADQSAFIAEKRSEIAATITTFTKADRFLDHAGRCVHPVVAECGECAGFAVNRSDNRLTPRGS
ncbi:hypothetical protein ACFVMC_29540 [Nocardia sp. NPDC127579]|uniref:hypothetical protein n=1 Tax=Nocardia sp. NPDC127579 TaxID=3345402 RepID=UPI0036379869